MDYTNLGTSGLKVSRIALGCMSFGTPRDVMPWTLDEDAAQAIFRHAVDLGITFWDSANVYGAGTSEEIVGRAIKRLTTREQVVLATKLYWPMHPGPGGSGLSRKAILEQVDASLRRLGTDYVDLLQIHRYDPDVPIDETMEALHDVVVHLHGDDRYGAGAAQPGRRQPHRRRDQTAASRRRRRRARRRAHRRGGRRARNTPYVPRQPTYFN